MNRLPGTFVLFILLLCSCAATTAQEPVTEDAPPSNYLAEKAHFVDGRLYIGPQPLSADLQNLKVEGIQRVVSFRTPSEMENLDFREEQQLADLGIDYVEIPVSTDKYPYSPAQLDTLADILQKDGKVLLHCRTGYRASVITVAYLIEKQGMPINEAVRHAGGWWPLALEQVLGEELSLVRNSTL